MSVERRRSSGPGRHRRPPRWALGWLACALVLCVLGAAVITTGLRAGSREFAVAAAQAPAEDVRAAPSVAPVAAGTISPDLPSVVAPSVVEAVPAALDSAADPVRVQVPRLRIAAVLDPLVLGAAGELVPPRYGRAGWYQRGPEPGEAGRAVIAGHVDSMTGPDVFFNLSRARVGDRVVVELADASRVLFKVVRVGVYPKDEFPTSAVYGGPRKAAELRLITCGGDYVRSQGGYQDNVVVFAVRA